MKKNISACLLACSILFSSASAAVIELPIGENALSRFENGSLTSEVLDAPAYINEASRTMVPVRAVSQAFGADVAWLPETMTVHITKDDREILLTVGSNTATVNGTATTLDSIPVIRNDRTMVPLRFIGEALGTTVSYSNGTVLLDNTEVLLKCGDHVFTAAQLDTLRALYYAWNEGEMGSMDAETFEQSCIHTAVLRAMSILEIENAFPEAVLPSDAVQSVFAESAAVGTLSDMPLSGMLDLMYERLYFSTGVPLLDVVRASQTDFEGRYQSEYVCAKHVLCENEETALSVYEKAKNGEDFDALVSTFGTDPGMTQNPGGYVFTKGEMVLPFEEAAFSAAEGEITAPVKTDFGYHVIQRLPLPPLTEDFIDTMLYTDVQKRLSAASSAEYVKSYEEIMAMFTK